MIKSLDKIKILDILEYRYYFRDYHKVIVDRMPIFKFEHKGDLLVAEDSGFVKVYMHDNSGMIYRPESRIHMLDGFVICNTGQWWNLARYNDLPQVEVATDPNGKFTELLMRKEVYNDRFRV